MDKSNYVIVSEALTKLGVKLDELMRRAKLQRDRERNTLLSEQAAKRDYEHFKHFHKFPAYLIEYSLDVIGDRIQDQRGKGNSNVRNLNARRSGVVDLNARRTRKNDNTK